MSRATRATGDLSPRDDGGVVRYVARAFVRRLEPDGLGHAEQVADRAAARAHLHVRRREHGLEALDASALHLSRCVLLGLESERFPQLA